MLKRVFIIALLIGILSQSTQGTISQLRIENEHGLLKQKAKDGVNFLGQKLGF